MKKIFFLFFISLSFTSISQISWNDKFDNFLSEWKNVPYKYGGTTKKGIDCSAFTQKIFSCLYEIQIPRTSSKQYKFTERIETDSLKFGDLVFFKSKLSPSGWHVGFYLGGLKFLHASNRKEDIKISFLNEDKYKKNFLGGGRVNSISQKTVL